MILYDVIKAFLALRYAIRDLVNYSRRVKNWRLRLSGIDKVGSRPRVRIVRVHATRVLVYATILK